MGVAVEERHLEEGTWTSLHTFMSRSRISRRPESAPCPPRRGAGFNVAQNFPGILKKRSDCARSAVPITDCPRERLVFSNMSTRVSQRLRTICLAEPLRHPFQQERVGNLVRGESSDSAERLGRAFLVEKVLHASDLLLQRGAAQIRELVVPSALSFVRIVSSFQRLDEAAIGHLAYVAIQSARIELDRPIRTNQHAAPDGIAVLSAIS